MNSPLSEDRPTPSSRWEYRVPSGLSLTEILERIRAAPAPAVILDISAHEPLRRDGALRRALVAAAADVQKDITFSVLTSPQAESPLSSSETERKRRSSDPPSSRSPRSSARERIPVSIVKTAREDQGNDARTNVILPRLGTSGRRIAIVFAIFAAGLVGIAAFVLAPRAEIVIDPIAEPVSLDLVLRLVTREENSSAGVVHAKLLVHEEVVEGEFPVEHVVEHGERARGRVELVNRTGGAQSIKGGSRLVSQEGMVFRTAAGVSVPANGTTHVDVHADDGGTRGNLQGGTLTFAALPNAESVLFARVAEPLVGGTDQPVRTLGAKDIARATEKLGEQAGTTARDRLRATFPPGSFVRDELIRMMPVDVRPREIVGTETDVVHVQAKIRVEAILATEEDILRASSAIASARSEGMKVLGRPLNMTDIRVRQVRWNDGIADLEFHVENILHEDFHQETLVERLAGRTEDGAEEFLKGLPGVKDADVTLWPFWVRRIPSIPGNVPITIRLPE